MHRLLLFFLCLTWPVALAAADLPASDVSATDGPVSSSVVETPDTPAWHALYLRFRSGQADAAFTLIRRHFAPIDSVYGRRLVVPGERSEWDAIIFTRLVADPSGKTWVANPVPEIWLEALAAQEGGMEEALAVLQRFDGLIAASETDLLVQSDAPDWAMRVLR